ncbi:MAG: sensor histidine kinase [Candidatus Nitrosomaritimum aestuariumsis]|nr:GAF domain-containing protein [Nitrosopumilaceae archaeon]
MKTESKKLHPKLGEVMNIVVENQLPVNEKERIKSLHSLNILDTTPEEKFDRITKIAQIIFDVPIALISLVDVNRQWFKSCVGLSERETSRSVSFCSHAILSDDIFVIEDATKDERFADSPLVTGRPYVRFYAGKPIRAPDGMILGTLCVKDKVPRKFSRADRSVLTDLAKWVESEMNAIALTDQLKQNNQKLMMAEQILREQNIDLEEKVRITTEKLVKSEKLSAIGTMASRLAHDMKDPLSVITATFSILEHQLENQIDKSIKEKFTRINQATTDITRIIQDTLNFVRSSELEKSQSSITKIMKNTLTNMNIPKSVKVIFPENDVIINCDSRKMGAVFSNIIINAIQAVKNSGTINLKIEQNETKVFIKFEDSGPGIPKEILPKIFDPLFTSKEIGTGLGLGICKSIIEQHEGKISVLQNPTTFVIELPK